MSLPFLNTAPARTSATRLGALTARHDHQEPGFDKMVLQAAYRADPAGFLDTWRAEISAPAPGWLTGDDGDSAEAATP